jgi:hypothetical protein
MYEANAFRNVGTARRLHHTIKTECVTFLPSVLSVSSFVFYTYNENYLDSLNKSLLYPYLTHASVDQCSEGRRDFYCVSFKFVSLPLFIQRKEIVNSGTQAACLSLRQTFLNFVPRHKQRYFYLVICNEK